MANTNKKHDEAVEVTLEKLKELNATNWHNHFEEIEPSSHKGIDIEAKHGEERLYFIVLKMKRGKGAPFDATKPKKWELALKYYGKLYFVAAIESRESDKYDFCFMTPERLWHISSVPQFQFMCKLTTTNIGKSINQALLPYDDSIAAKFGAELKDKVAIMNQLNKGLKNLKK